MQSPRAVLPRVFACTLLLVAACGSLRQQRPARLPPGENTVKSEGGAVVLTGAALQEGQGGTLLSAMIGKVPSFRVRRGGRCPEITLRQASSYTGPANPSVYVDGTHATDTCILDQLRALDVERVEVYPQGFTTRPGYGTHQHGLILVFMRGAEHRS